MPEPRSGRQVKPLPQREANFSDTSSHPIDSEERDLLPPPEPDRPPPLQLPNNRTADPTFGPLFEGGDGRTPKFVGYEILGELGRGGMGIVYKAHHRQRNQVVALKTLAGIDPEALYRFKQEFRTLADVKHPNLVTLYELISDGNQWFFTMELVPGVDFLTYVGCGSYLLDEPTTDFVTPSFPRSHSLPSDGGMKEETQRSVLTSRQLSRLREGLRQLVQGILALHEAGKLHRDIKPRNVLVTPQERVVLVDFGFATQLGDTGLHQSTDNRIVGTAAYMAPEQAAGKPVSAASDWYSVGVILYEALTGQLPYQGSRWQILQAKREQDPPPPTAIPTGIPEDLNTLCIELLQRDPASRPAGEELLRRLGPLPSLSPTPSNEDQGQLAPPYTPRHRVALVGRKWHRSVLNEVYQDVKHGRTRILCVHGSSGMGKTALVQYFLDDLVDRREAVVLAGRCYEQESVPYKALDSLVDALSQYLRRLPPPAAHALMPRDVLALARVFPVLRQVEAVDNAPHRDLTTTDGQELRRRAFTALRELLARLGDRVPLVLFIDDLQWGDVDSAAMLAELLRPPDPPVLLLLACYRSEDVRRSRCLQALVQASKDSAVLERRELAVEALAPGEARDLAAALLGHGNPLTLARAETIARESVGNPFFVFQLTQSIQDHAVSMAPGAAEEMPALDKVLWARITRLPEAARRLLEVVAVAGAPLRRADARPAADLQNEEPEVLVVLRSGHLIRATGLTEQEEIETYHDRIRETIVARLPPITLQSHHKRLALTLQASGQADPEVLAVHFEGAGDTPQAGRYYALAAHQASEALAFDRAAKLYRLALDMGPADETNRSNLRTKLGDALANAGRGAEAAREYLAAAPMVDAAARLDLQRRAAYQYLISGHFDAGLATMEEVLRAVGLKLPATPRRALLSLLLRRCWLRVRGLRSNERGQDAAQVQQAELARLDTYWSAATGMALIDIIRAADLQVRGLLLALRVGDPIRLTRALALEAIYSAADGERSHGHTAKLLRQAENLGQKIDHPYTRGVIGMAQGAVSFLEAHFQPALPPLAEAEEVFRDRCTGVAWELDLARFYQLMSLLYQGKVADLARRAPVLLKQALERSDLFAATNLNTYFIPFILLASDDPEGARHTVRQALGLWSQQGFHTQHALALVSEVQVDLYRGEGSAAWDRLMGQWPDYTGSLLKRIQHTRIVMHSARARSALAAATNAADPRPFWRAAEADARRLEREKATWAVGLAGLVRSGLAMARGNASKTQEQLTAALLHLDRIGIGLHAAAARRRLGYLVGGDQGHAWTDQAGAWMAAQGIVNPSRMTSALIPGFPEESRDSC